MNNLSIADAVENIFELMEVLDDAYWEANTCEEKDYIDNLANILVNEYIELNKVSVQDHHFEYEVISISQEALKQALTQFQLRVPKQIRRQTTLIKLNSLLNILMVSITSS